jgi:hypothetical protein
MRTWESDQSGCVMVFKVVATSNEALSSLKPVPRSLIMPPSIDITNFVMLCTSMSESCTPFPMAVHAYASSAKRSEYDSKNQKQQRRSQFGIILHDHQSIDDNYRYKSKDGNDNGIVNHFRTILMNQLHDIASVMVHQISISWNSRIEDGYDAGPPSCTASVCSLSDQDLAFIQHKRNQRQTNEQRWMGANGYDEQKKKAKKKEENLRNNGNQDNNGIPFYHIGNTMSPGGLRLEHSAVTLKQGWLIVIHTSVSLP